MTARVAITLLPIIAAVAVLAIVVATVALFQVRATRAALRASEAKHRERAERDRRLEAGGREAGDVAHAAAHAPGDGNARVTTPPTPILVVEDEPGVRELIKRILLRAGREVVIVAGPHEALAALNRQPAIALMLIDVVMPEMDGYQLAAEARTIAPGVKAVFISAFAQDSTRHPVGDGFLAKPFTTESLTGIVDTALGPVSA